MDLARRAITLVIALALAAPAALAQAPLPETSAPDLSRDEMRQFLQTAKIVKSRDIGKGVTRPKRLTLTQGALTHDAAFQAVDEKKVMVNLAQPGRAARMELNFVDHYRYNLAANGLAELLGLDYMMPVHVKRRWDGREGSLSWWVTTLMDDGERVKKKIPPPDPTDWNQQMYRMRVFAALTRDTDRNLGNVLITPEWKVVMIDFTRAFRLQAELLYSEDMPKIDRALLPRIEALTKESIAMAVGDSLTSYEADAVLKRRDLIVAHFRKLIAEQGEDRVLY